MTKFKLYRCFFFILMFICLSINAESKQNQRADGVLPCSTSSLLLGGSKCLNDQRSVNAALMMPKKNGNHGGGRRSEGGHKDKQHGHRRPRPPPTPASTSTTTSSG